MPLSEGSGWGYASLPTNTSEKIHVTQLLPGWVPTHNVPKTILLIMPGPMKLTATVFGIAPMSPVWLWNSCVLTPDQGPTITQHNEFTSTHSPSKRKSAEIMKDKNKNKSELLIHC